MINLDPHVIVMTDLEIKSPMIEIVFIANIVLYMYCIALPINLPQNAVMPSGQLALTSKYCIHVFGLI